MAKSAALKSNICSLCVNGCAGRSSFFSGLLASLRVRIHYPTYVNAGLPPPPATNLCTEIYAKI